MILLLDNFFAYHGELLQVGHPKRCGDGDVRETPISKDACVKFKKRSLGGAFRE
jgi:hypothetical protein